MIVVSLHNVDDVTHLSASKRATTIRKNLNEEASSQFSSYCNDWKLKVNLMKSEGLLFTKKRSQRTFPRHRIVAKNQEIP